MESTAQIKMLYKAVLFALTPFGKASTHLYFPQLQLG